MKKQNLKKVISLVAGSLVIALVVSIFPGGFLVNAAEVSRREAREIALEYVNDDSAEITVVDDKALDDDEPYYTVMIKTDKYKYEIVVDAKTGEIESKLNKKVAVIDAKTGAKLSEDKDEIVKTTAEAKLNQELQEDMKDAITDHKEALDALNKDDENYKEDKEEIRSDFKDAKDVIKEERKDTMLEIKEDKKETTDAKLVKNVNLTKEQALLIALKKVGVDIEDKQLKQLNTSNKYEFIFDDVDNIEIVLDNDKNPSVYIVEFKFEGIVYTIEVQATTGKILDYSKVKVEVEKVNNGKNKEEKDKDNEDKNVKSVEKGNKGKNNK